MSDDVIQIDLPDKRLIVNGVAIPFPQLANVNRHVKDVGGFSLESPCNGPLLFARVKGNGALEIELPSSGLMLRIRSEDAIVIKVRILLCTSIHIRCFHGSFSALIIIVKVSSKIMIGSNIFFLDKIKSKNNTKFVIASIIYL